MTLPGTALSDDDLRRERRRLRRPGLAWVGVTLLFALPLVFESAYALSGGDHYLPAVATVERAAGSDTGLRLAWEGEDGHDTYDLDAFAVDELQLEVGDDVAVRYQSGDDGAYLPDIESVDPDTLADPGDPALWLPLLLSALTTGTLVRTSRAGVRRLRAACAPNAVRTPYDAGWLLLGRAGHPVAELTPPHGARAYAVGPAGCLHASDLPRSLEVLGAPRRGDLLLTPTTDGVRSLGRWCRPVPSSLTKAVPLPATARLLPRTYVHAAVQTLARISLLLVASSFGFAVAGGGRAAAGALAVGLLLGLGAAHLSRQRVRLDDAGVGVQTWPGRRVQVPWADVAGLEPSGRRQALVRRDGTRVVLPATSRPGRLSTRQRREVGQRPLADIAAVVAAAT